MNSHQQPTSILGPVGFQTLLCVAFSVTATVVCLRFFVGGNFAAAMDVGRLWGIALAVSVISPLAVVPLIAAPSAIRFRKLQRARDELASAVCRDSLTGLLNRRGFDEAADRMLADCEREDGYDVAIMCDVDRFKSINDRFGHDFGDIALAHIAAIIEASLEGRDAILGRRGGEEFAILLPDCELADAVVIAQAMREACDALPLNWEGIEAKITISLGVAAAAPNTYDLRTLLSLADAALYQAKRDGRNRVVWATERQRKPLAA